jgi:glycosyltransferase involved in cell wall biosynthesis
VLYYEDSNHLSELLASWSALEPTVKRQLVFLVVDDGSRRVKAQDVLLHAPKIDIINVRIEEDIPWNIGGARNLAMFVAPTSYVFLMDADVRTPPRFILDILSLSKKAEHDFRSGEIRTIFCRFRRKISGELADFERPHPAVMLLSRDAYWLSGGCDEDFVGHYGYTDPHFLHRASQTPGIKLVSVYLDRKYISNLIQVNDKPDYSSVHLERNAEYNKELFHSKLAKNTWSNSYIRFNWTYV